jgi:hypothetical protein
MTGKEGIEIRRIGSAHGRPGATATVLQNIRQFLPMIRASLKAIFLFAVFGKTMHEGRNSVQQDSPIRANFFHDFD